MRALRALAGGEIRRLYRSPLAWFVLALGAGFMAVLFMLLLVRYLDHESELRAAGVTQEVLVRYFVTANLGVALALPLLTMGCVAGDRAQGVLRFLFSAPLSAFDILAGKLLGVLSLAGAYVVLVALIPVTLYWGTPLDTGIYLANVLGLALFTLMHACLGVLASALTRAPLIAAVMTLSIALALWLADWAVRLDPEASVVGGISTLGRLRGFLQGLIGTADVVYFVAASASFVALATLAIAAERRLT